MFNKRTILFLITSILLISVVSAIPGSWYGYVTINGTNANRSTNVSILLNNVYQTYVPTGSIGSEQNHYYLISVQGTPSDTIILQVNGINASQGAQSWAESQHYLNLSVNKSANGASCTYSAACIGGYCCNGGTLINDGVTTGGTCQATACAAAAAGGTGGGGGGSGGGGGGGGAASETFNPISDQQVKDAIAQTVPSDWNQVVIEQATTSIGMETSTTTESSISSAESQVTSQEAKDAINSLENLIKSNEADGLTVTRVLTTIKISNPETGDARFRSQITIQIKGGEKGKENVEIIEVIPKSVAASVNDIIFVGKQPKVLQADPVVQWVIEKIKAGDTQELSYIVKKKLTKDESLSLAVGKDITVVEKPVVEETTIPQEPEEKPKVQETPIQEEEKRQTNILAILLVSLLIIILVLAFKYIRKNVKKGSVESVGGHYKELKGSDEKVKYQKDLVDKEVNEAARDFERAASELDQAKIHHNANNHIKTLQHHRNAIGHHNSAALHHRRLATHLRENNALKEDVNKYVEAAKLHLAAAKCHEEIIDDIKKGREVDLSKINGIVKDIDKRLRYI